MKYLKSYRQHNEGIKSTLAGLGLAGALFTGSPQAKADTLSSYPTEQQYQESINSIKVRQMCNQLSEMRKQSCKDERLSSILDEIQNNSETADSAKLVEMFDKLSLHLKEKYDYTIKDESIEELSKKNVEEIKETEPAQMSLYSILGWLGSVCLALCGVPQALQSYKDKHSHGITWGMLLLWAFGEVFALAYVFNKLDAPLILNYAINIFVVGLMLYYKLKPESPETSPTEL